MLPIYKYIVNENDETGVDFNAMVDVPAHMKGFVAFGENNRIRYEFNEEQRMVTGVMISAGTPIYRSSRGDIPAHYGIFDKHYINVIRKKFHKNNFNNNVNEMHDSQKVMQGVYMVESYVIGNSPMSAKAPEVFASQNLQEGTWIATYYIESDVVWSKVKSGKFYGFSVEGIFDHELVKIKMKNKMSKEKKSLFSIIFGNEEKQTFAEATTVDGVIVFYEGELAEGTAVFIEADGERIPAPEGDHQIVLSETESIVITVDANGIVTGVEAVEAPAEEEGVEALSKEEVAEFIREYHAKIDEQFSGLKKELEKRDERIADLEKALKGNKFGAEKRKTSEPSKLTYKDLINKK